jgi:hypothetical protein
MVLALEPVFCQNWIYDFLYNHGVSCDLNTVNDGGDDDDLSDLMYTARIYPHVKDDVVFEACESASEELGPAYRLVYEKVKRLLVITVRQPSEQQSYAMESWMRRARVQLLEQTWPPLLILAVLVCSATGLLLSLVKLLELWADHESPWLTPFHFALDYAVVLTRMALAAWPVTLLVMALIIFGAWRCMCRSGGSQQKERRVTAWVLCECVCLL